PASRSVPWTPSFVLVAPHAERSGVARSARTSEERIDSISASYGLRQSLGGVEHAPTSALSQTNEGPRGEHGRNQRTESDRYPARRQASERWSRARDGTFRVPSVEMTPLSQQSPAAS